MIACSLWNKFFVIIIITAPFWDASRASPAYEVSFSQNVTFARVSREIEDFLKGKQEEI
jgi:hypothetical protein